MNCVNRLLLLSLCFLLLSGPLAWAHNPIFPDGHGCNQADSIAVQDIAVSQVAYTELTPECPQLWLTFEAAANQNLYLQIALPQIERYKNLRPAVAILGPGLPEVTGLPFAVPAGYGAYVFTSDDVTEPTPFYEPFTGTNSWILKEINQNLPNAGQYYLVAYFPSGEFGKIWVAFGQTEAFGLNELLQFNDIVNTVRTFHEVGPRVDICPLIGFLPVALGVGLLPLLWKAHKRR